MSFTFQTTNASTECRRRDRRCRLRERWVWHRLQDPRSRSPSSWRCCLTSWWSRCAGDPQANVFQRFGGFPLIERGLYHVLEWFDFFFYYFLQCNLKFWVVYFKYFFFVKKFRIYFLKRKYRFKNQVISKYHGFIKPACSRVHVSVYVFSWKKAEACEWNIV